MSNHDLRLLRSNGAEQDQVLGRRKGFGLFFEEIFDPLKANFDPLSDQKSISELPPLKNRFGAVLVYWWSILAQLKVLLSGPIRPIFVQFGPI